MLCVTLGRPTMVAVSGEDPVPLPLELDEEAFQSRHVGTYVESGVATSTALAGSTRSALSFFVHSIKLFRIVHLILLSFYYDEDSNSVRDYNDYFTGPTSIFDLDTQMMKWIDEIPAHIQFDTYNLPMADELEHMRTFRRQAVVLRVR